MTIFTEMLSNDLFLCPFCLSLFAIYLGNRVFCYTGATELTLSVFKSSIMYIEPV
jgi:hypothetical protein